MNEQSLGQEPKPFYPKESRLLVDDFLEQEFGLTFAELGKLPPEEKRQVKARIRELINAPEVQEVIGEDRITGRLNAEEASKIREALGVKKWQDLSHLVSYVKTIIGETSEGERKETYEQHLALGVDANELKRTLSEMHDVYPARIDTDIKHQSALFYRAVVEVVSNALDASIKDRSPIGRFGIGFYQILNHLDDPEDRVIVATKSIDSSVGVRIEFRKKGEDIDFNISEDDSIKDHGTRVELKSKKFKAEGAEGIISEYFPHNQEARIILNGEELQHWQADNNGQDRNLLPAVSVKVEDGRFVVTDHGTGMDARVVFEKLLVPKLSNKPPVYELKEKGELKPKLWYETEKGSRTGKCTIVIQVGGIQVEKMVVDGHKTAKTLALDLPPSTILGEQRDQIEVDQQTIEAMREIIDNAVSLPRPACFEVLNGLVAVCDNFQNRSKSSNREDNLLAYLRQKVGETFPNDFFLPNKKDFDELELPENVVLLNPNVYSSAFNSVPVLKEVGNWSGRSPLYKARFKQDSSKGLIVDDNVLIIDDRIDTDKYNDYLSEAIRLLAGYGQGSFSLVDFSKIIDREGSAERTLEQKEVFGDLSSFVKRSWKECYFASPEIALRQAKIFDSKFPVLAKAFSELIFSQLDEVADPSQFWDLMQHYAYYDERPESVKLEEIKQLADNLRVIFSDPKLREIISRNNLPLISCFERYNAELPNHVLGSIEERWGSSNYRRLEIDGTLYHLFILEDHGERGSTTCYKKIFSEDGSYVSIGGPGKVLYQDKEYEVYEDKIINPQTKEVLEVEFPINTPFGQIRQGWNRFGHKEIAFDLVPELRKEKGTNSQERKEYGLRTYADPNATESEKLIDNEGRTFYVSSSGTLFINGERQDSLGDKNIKELEVRAITKTKKGGILVMVGKVERGDKPFSKRELREEEAPLGPETNIDDSSEEFYLLNSKGETVWQLDETKWGRKVFISEGFDYDVYNIPDNGNTPSRCVAIDYGTREVSGDDLIIRIVRYPFIGSGRFRETLAYVTADGQEINVKDVKEVSPITLADKYSHESSCNCCQADNPFTIGRFDPTDKKGNVPLENLIDIPATVTGQFHFDPVEKEWCASGLLKGQRGDGYCLVVLDEQGNYLRCEAIGQTPEEIGGDLDFRYKKSPYLRRLPKGFVGISEEDLKWDRNIEHIYESCVDGGREIPAILSNRTPAMGQYGSVSHSRKLKEKNLISNDFLAEEGEALTPGHNQAIINFLSSYPNPSRVNLERLFYRSLQYHDLGVDDFKVFLPVFYGLDHLAEGVINPENLPLLRKIGYLDSDRFVDFIKVLNRSLPEDIEKSKEVLAKLIKFYTEKLQNESAGNARELFDNLSVVTDYSNSVSCDGYNLIKYGTEVPQNEIPRSIRPLITFMQKPLASLAVVEELADEVKELTPRTIRLSEIIQWKRLNETEAREFSAGDDELKGMVDQTCEGKTRDHVVREITHAVHFQALNGTDLYIRELIQNAVDAMKADERDEDKKIDIRVTTDDEHNLTTHFYDPVGMDLPTILNYFLVPGETTKKEGQFIGFYGQGIYTLFQNFKQIQIKTSPGDGSIHYLTMRPVVEHGLISDVTIDFKTATGDFKGTQISKVQEVENPYVEAAYVYDSVMSLTSGLDEGRGAIHFQGEKINSKYPVLGRQDVGNLGQVTVYRNPNNMVTQYGLFVKEDNEYLSSIPSFMGKALKDWGGVVIDLPTDIQLTRSRQDIASKDRFAEILNPAIQTALVGSYLESFKEKIKEDPRIFPYEELPYDYFVLGELYGVPDGYRQDFENLFAGKPLQFLEDYKDKSKAIKLLSLIPFFEVGGKTFCLDDMRIAMMSPSDKPIFPFDQPDWREKLPYKLVGIIEKQQEAKRENEQAKRRDQQNREKGEGRSFGDTNLDEIIEKAQGDWKEWLTSHVKGLRRLDQITDAFLSILHPVFQGGRRPIEHGYYYSEEGSLAHARRGSLISWNLQPIERKHWGSPNVEELSKDEPVNEKGLPKTISVLCHEYGHVIEDFAGWTHDESHEKEQGRVLLQFIRHDGPGKLIAAIKE